MLIEVIVASSLFNEIGGRTIAVSSDQFEEIDHQTAKITYKGKQYKGVIKTYFDKDFQRDMHETTIVEKW